MFSYFYHKSLDMVLFPISSDKGLVHTTYHLLYESLLACTICMYTDVHHMWLHSIMVSHVHHSTDCIMLSNSFYSVYNIRTQSTCRQYIQIFSYRCEHMLMHRYAPLAAPESFYCFSAFCVCFHFLNSSSHLVWAGITEWQNISIRRPSAFELCVRDCAAVCACVCVCFCVMPFPNQVSVCNWIFLKHYAQHLIVYSLFARPYRLCCLLIESDGSKFLPQQGSDCHFIQ